MNDVVTICGSMRGYSHMLETAQKLTLDGYIVLMPFVTKDDDLTPDMCDELDGLHRRKMAMSHSIVVVTVNGYVGESTRQEITYASERGLDVKWYNYVMAPVAPTAYADDKPQPVPDHSWIEFESIRKSGAKDKDICQECVDHPNGHVVKTDSEQMTKPMPRGWNDAKLRAHFAKDKALTEAFEETCSDDAIDKTW